MLLMVLATWGWAAEHERWVSWLVLLAEFPGGCLGFVVVDGGDLVWLKFTAFAGSC